MIEIKYGKRKYLNGSVCYNLYFYIRKDIYVVTLYHEGFYKKRSFLRKPLFIWLVEADDFIEKEKLWNFSKDEIRKIIDKLDNISPEFRRILLKAL